MVNNITNPGFDPVDGDWIEIIHGSGSIERKAFRAPPAGHVPTLDDVKALKIVVIRAYFNAVIVGVKANAAPYEIDTWETQRAEYMAWQANSLTPTPYVSALAAARGLTVPELMALIAPKVSWFATIQGTQHKLEKLVEAATTIDEVEAITW